MPHFSSLSRFSSFVLCLALAPALLSSWRRVPQQEPASAPARDATPEIRKLIEDLMAANNAGDIERAIAYYTPDALLLPPTEPEVSGREKIRTHYTGAFGRFALRVTATAQEIRSCADWGVVRGTVQGTLTEKTSEESRPLNDKFLGIVERGADGKWRLSRMMWSPVAAAGGPR
jgi:uncharacterized protein (TIGR02246 family)